MKYTRTPASESLRNASVIPRANGCSSASSPIQYSNRSPSTYKASAAGAVRCRKYSRASFATGVSGARCRSEMKSVCGIWRDVESTTGWNSPVDPRTSSLYLDHFRFLYDHVFLGHVLVHSLASCGHGLYLVDDFAALDHATKHAVTVGIGRGGTEVEEIVLGDIDKKLPGCGVRIRSTCHGDRIDLVLETVFGLVPDRRPRGLLLHAGFKTAALNHEAVDHSMEHGVVVKAVVYVLQKVFHAGGGLGGIELEDDVAERSLQFYAAHFASTIRAP